MRIEMKRYSITILLTYLFLVTANHFVCAGETDPDAIYKDGLAKLRQAQSDPGALVPAARLLSKAATLYENAGNEAKVQEVNSCLYWARKKMTLADVEKLNDNVEVTKTLEAAVKTVDVSEAQGWLDRADEFAKKQVDPLVIAIRYFEVGDRFKDSDAGRKAIDLSLKAMQRIGEKTALAEYKPTATDAKVLVQSEPAGAQIFLIGDGAKKDTGKKTPSVVLVPRGHQTIMLQMAGMNPATFELDVVENTVNKPDTIKLMPKTAKLDLSFEPGWIVHIDGKMVRGADKKRVETPCIADVPLGAHELALAKNGFLDIVQRINLKDNMALEVKARPSAGTSKLLSAIDILPDLTGMVVRVVPDGIEVKATAQNSPHLEHAGANYTAPLKFLVTFKTDSQIRFYIGQQGRLILGWEVNPSELRFQDPITGEITGAKGKGAVSPNQWHTLSWTMLKDRVVILLDEKELFTKKGNFEAFSGTIGVGPCVSSTVTLKSFLVSLLGGP